MKLNWYTKYLLRFNPQTLFQNAARENNIDDKKIDSANALFMDAKRIDIQPLSNKMGRGFIITINNGLSLWFYQNGDTFKYDGFEIGPYNDGDVTVFDEILDNPH